MRTVGQAQSKLCATTQRLKFYTEVEFYLNAIFIVLVSSCTR